MTASPGTDRDIQSSDPEQGAVGLFDLLIILAKYKKLIIGVPLVVAIAAAAYALYLPDVYTASTKILPPQQGQSSAAGMLSQLGLGGIVGGGGLGMKNPNDLYVGMLQSRRVADGLIERFDLNAVFQEKLPSDTRATLKGMTRIESEKDGMIVISVDDTDPKRAADLANAYTDELYKLMGVLAVTEAAQRRLFFERQLAQAKENLARVEASARESLAKGGLVQVEGQGRAVMEATARLRAQITVKEVQIGAMRAFAGEHNPELLAAQQELQATRRQLAKMEGEGAARANPVKTPAGSNGIDNLSLLRDVRYHETIFELLAKQYELAKIEEAKDASLIQVLDKAIVPDRKSKPMRRNIVLLAMLAAFFVMTMFAIVREAVLKTYRNPEQAGQWSTLKRYLAWR